jgi:hypothetical protein
MPKEKKIPVKNKKSKKGLKVFLVLFGLIFLTVLLYQVVNLLNKAVYESKSVQVNVDVEWGTSGTAQANLRSPKT